MVGRGGCLGRSAIRISGFSNAFYNATDSVYRCCFVPLSPLYVYIYIYLEEEIRIPRDSWEKTEGEEEVVISLGFSVAFTPASHCSRPSTRHCATIGDWGCTIDAGCIHADSS